MLRVGSGGRATAGGEKPLSEEIDLYFATGLCSWCSHLLTKDDD